MGQLLLSLRRHHLRPNHLRGVIDTPYFHKVTTALYPEGDPRLSSDDIFGAKKSLVVVRIHHPLVGVACAPVVRVVPRACLRPSAFLFFTSPCLEKLDFYALDRNSLRSMTTSGHESAGSRTVPSSSCPPTYDIVLLTEDEQKVTHVQRRRMNPS